MATQTSKGTEHPQPSGTALGFALTVPQRWLCGVVGLALMGFGCYSAYSDGPNAVAALALGSGFLLLVAGLVGRFGRFTLHAGGTGVTYEADYPTSVPEEASPEQTPPPPPTVLKPDPVKVELVVADKGTGSDPVHVDKRAPFLDALTALGDKDYSTFDSKMLEVIDSEADEGRKVSMKAFRLGRLYCGGQTNRMEELQALRQEYSESPYPLINLGDCYDLPASHEKAAELYGEGLELPKLSADQRLMLLARQAGALRKAKLFEEAEACLTKGLQRADTDTEKAEVEKLLAELYKDWRKKDEMLVHFEKAVELSPGDVDARFELAYGYSEAGYKLGAFHHYEILRGQRDGPSERNNLGVILQGLDMPISAAKCYHRAAEQKETLAAANLARMMADGGMVEQAKAVLAEARKEEKVDEAVDRVSAGITRWEENEKERLEKIKEAAKTERSLLLRRFELEREDLNPVGVEDIEGTWQTSVGDMTFQRQDNKLVARFKERYWDWELTGQVSGRTYSFGWTCARTTQNQEGDGFFIFRTDGEFEGIIRHTPAKGEVRLVTGTDRKPLPPPREPTQPPAVWLEDLLSGGQQG